MAKTKEKSMYKSDHFFMEVVVCPYCQKINEMDLDVKTIKDIRPIGDLLSGILYGYYLKCDCCNHIEFIPVINEGFKLFDLSQKFGVVPHE